MVRNGVIILSLKCSIPTLWEGCLIFLLHKMIYTFLDCVLTAKYWFTSSGIQLKQSERERITLWLNLSNFQYVHTEARSCDKGSQVKRVGGPLVWTTVNTEAIVSLLSLTINHLSHLSSKNANKSQLIYHFSLFFLYRCKSIFSGFWTVGWTQKSNLKMAPWAWELQTFYRQLINLRRSWTRSFKSGLWCFTG